MEPKASRLRRYKYFASGLLLLMLLLYLSTYLLFKEVKGIGFLRAFAEAGMVGALADWFAVTALFRHPLGLPIPHTNLIEKSKTRIGSNLGDFISSNFLNADTIRPRLERLKIASAFGNWLLRPQNRTRIITELRLLLREGIGQLPDGEVELLLQHKAKELIQQLPLSRLAGKAIEALVEQGAHQEWAQLIARQLEAYLTENKDWLKEKVKSESHILVPGFVDNIIAGRMLKGIRKFLRDFASSVDHPQQRALTEKLLSLARKIKTEAKWEGDLNTLRDRLLSDVQLNTYSGLLWQHLKQLILGELTASGSFLDRYLDQSLKELGSSFVHDPVRQDSLNRFARAQAFRLILKNRHHVAELIGQTVGKWEGRSLSDKLELEIGKDLQFIRINGTLVGGLIGILIHALTLWLDR